MKSKMQSSEDIFLAVLGELDFGSKMFESRSREGIFTPAVTMWLMIAQRVMGGRGLADVVQALAEGDWRKIWEKNSKSKRLRVTDISLNSSAFSQAISRLDVEMVRKVTEAISERASKQSKRSWHGRRIYLCDGTTLGLEASKEILEDYKPTRNQHGAAYTPDMQCIFCHELWSGTAMNVQFAAYRGPKSSSEQQLCIKVLDGLPKSSLLIADRNFGIFTVAYEAERREIQTLVRLTTSRAKAIGGSFFNSSKNEDISINWKLRISNIPGVEIPNNANIQGRFIKHTIKRKGFRDLVLYFFTTSPESAEDLVELYAQRERIENDIRSIKYVLGMEKLRSKTPQKLEKEVLLGIAAYNLIRETVAIAANELTIEPRKISFSRATRLVQTLGHRLSGADKNAKNKIFERFIKGLNQIKLPYRAKFRIEPRKIVRQAQRFPRMKKSRAEERKGAMKILKENGHRGYFTTVTRDY